jgi:hypothetical protein
MPKIRGVLEKGEMEFGIQVEKVRSTLLDGDFPVGIPKEKEDQILTVRYLLVRIKPKSQEQGHAGKSPFPHFHIPDDGAACAKSCPWDLQHAPCQAALSAIGTTYHRYLADTRIQPSGLTLEGCSDCRWLWGHWGVVAQVGSKFPRPTQESKLPRRPKRRRINPSCVSFVKTTRISISWPTATVHLHRPPPRQALCHGISAGCPHRSLVEMGGVQLAQATFVVVVG